MEVKLTHIIAITSILLSAAGLVYVWRKDQALRKREYADRIRKACGTLLAKLERRQELVQSLFSDIQPDLTQADISWAGGAEFVTVRDELWNALAARIAATTRRVTEEGVQAAYVDLYGYDTRVQRLYREALAQLAAVDHFTQTMLLQETQDMVMRSNAAAKHEDVRISAKLGNKLRDVSAHIASKVAALSEEVVGRLNQEILRIVVASDDDIVNRRVSVGETLNVDLRAQIDSYLL